MAFCLSGGGYRAMVFHIGVLWRLYEAGLLRGIKRISSVSGGSITAGLLALKWRELSFEASKLKNDFVPKRFMKPYMRDYRVGEVKKPTVPLARAVAASSAFPPVLSPLVLQLDPSMFTPNSGFDLQRKPFTSRAFLTDGGVYDNLGLETAWKRYQTILVSDAAAKTQAEEKPRRRPLRHAYRVLDLVDNQVRSLRNRQLINSFKASEGDAEHRNGAHWGIRTNIKDYGLADALDCPFERTLPLAATSTRLKRLDDRLQERLINWGYAVCDAALRRHVDPNIAKPTGFPYPGSGV